MINRICPNGDGADSIGNKLLTSADSIELRLTKFEEDDGQSGIRLSFEASGSFVLEADDASAHPASDLAAILRMFANGSAGNSSGGSCCS
jgi:hypothetical protein